MATTIHALSTRTLRWACARIALVVLTGPAWPVAAGMALPVGLDRAILYRLPPNWREDRGGTLSLSVLQGKPVYVTMAYTSCHQICPTTLLRLAQIQQDLDSRGVSAEVLIVSYDPVNDDPAAWRRYRAVHHLAHDNWHFLSGTPVDTERLAQLLGFDYWRDGEHVMHDSRIVAFADGGAPR